MRQVSKPAQHIARVGCCRVENPSDWRVRDPEAVGLQKIEDVKMKTHICSIVTCLGLVVAAPSLHASGPGPASMPIPCPPSGCGTLH
jgi:hypothetical protein